MKEHPDSAYSWSPYGHNSKRPSGPVTTLTLPEAIGPFVQLTEPLTWTINYGPTKAVRG